MFWYPNGILRVLLVPSKLQLYHLRLLISEQSPHEPNPLYRLGRIPQQMATPSEQ
jgi:hypothetical protein